MKDVREMFNISYFDNKELSLKEHCDIYSNIKKELISILNKYDIKYVLAETEVIKDLSKENKSLKKQLEEADLELQLLDMRTDENIKYENQQKEFIKYMNDISEDLETEDVDDEEMKGYLIQRIDTFKEILQKYKSIIGGNDV